MNASRNRRAGNAMVMVLLLLLILLAFSTADSLVVQKNTRQSVFHAAHEELRGYADSGTYLALHDLRHTISASGGQIGTDLWTALNDVGRDGTPGTGDEGEGDGIPTPGEPNLSPEPIGPAEYGMGLLVTVDDTIWPNVKRIVSTAFDDEVIAAVETYAEEIITVLPRVGAIYVNPDIQMDLSGSAFTVSGNDTNPGAGVKSKGLPAPGPASLGIATDMGDPPGSNDSAVTDQIATSQYKQITGTGGTPSVNEVSDPIDFDRLFNIFSNNRDITIPPDTYSGVTWGTEADPKITYAKGPLHLSGGISNATGALVVDGDLVVSGQFTIVGLLIVRGNVTFTGGGGGIHIFGSALLQSDSLKISGTSDLKFSTYGIGLAESALRNKGKEFTVLYWYNLK